MLTASLPGTAGLAGIAPFGDGRDWFFEKRFGLFLHWGLYSIPGWHEQAQYRGRVPREEYVKLAGQWNPRHYDPDAWLDLAQEAGMEYVCLTTKHHDGFCLWDTRATTYNTMNTPYGRDVLAMLAAACQRRGVPLCLYYSCVDWHQPNYPNQGRHHELAEPGPGDEPDHDKYMDFVLEQVRELCTNYGEIHGFWWDMNVEEHRDSAVNALIRSLQPNAVINDRGYDAGDFGTPERDFFVSAGEVPQLARLTEACQSVGMESWGHRRDEDYYSDRHLLRGIDKYLALGGNYLLNAGPDGEGRIPPEAAAILKRIGTWYSRVSESLVDVTPVSHWTSNRDVLLTRRDNTLYAHLYREPAGDSIKLKPINLTPRRATLLNTGEPVEFVVDLPPSEHTSQAPVLRLCKLPVNELANTVLVVKLEFDELPANLGAVAQTAEGADILVM